jgi:hypothetical protein
MGEFCDRLKLSSTAAPDCRTGRYCEQELSFLLIKKLYRHLTLGFSFLIEENWDDTKNM